MWESRGRYTIHFCKTNNGAFPKLIKCKIYAYFLLNLAILDAYKCKLDTYKCKLDTYKCKLNTFR
jgi:hypothetical protein